MYDRIRYLRIRAGSLLDILDDDANLYNGGGIKFMHGRLLFRDGVKVIILGLILIRLYFRFKEQILNLHLKVNRDQDYGNADTYPLLSSPAG